ncbi:hypothetical protein BDZ97DRAFT_1319401 [Flammula alnicola]|nr:hypothetical protein BDZ97DRAFT_1319401 [Flammula alnicola]
MPSYSAWFGTSDPSVMEEPTDIGVSRRSQSIYARVLPRSFNPRRMETLPLPLHTAPRLSGSSPSSSSHPREQHSVESNYPRGDYGPNRYSTCETVVAPLNSPTIGCTPSPPSSSSSGTHETIDIPTRPDISKEIDDLIGVTSYEYERYERSVKTEKYFWDGYAINPLEVDFSRYVHQYWS